ncbi:MAG: (2Fe-2S)-binding protein [Lentisphaeria bacterium]|nr:(2Fe-2S)-binding protein [Lentisphaeria bacterium]NQZ67513.1 (2Fe-2S)-binding protein [Lentisphaeria bacterium]
MDKLVCYCFSVPEKVIIEAIKEKKLATIQEVMQETHAGCGCRGCWYDLDNLLYKHIEKKDEGSTNEGS